MSQCRQTFIHTLSTCVVFCRCCFKSAVVSFNRWGVGLRAAFVFLNPGMTKHTIFCCSNPHHLHTPRPASLCLSFCGPCVDSSLWSPSCLQPLPFTNLTCYRKKNSYLLWSFCVPYPAGKRDFSPISFINSENMEQGIVPSLGVTAAGGRGNEIKWEGSLLFPPGLWLVSFCFCENCRNKCDKDVNGRSIRSFVGFYQDAQEMAIFLCPPWDLFSEKMNKWKSVLDHLIFLGSGSVIPLIIPLLILLFTSPNPLKIPYHASVWWCSYYIRHKMAVAFIQPSYKIHMSIYNIYMHTHKHNRKSLALKIQTKIWRCRDGPISRSVTQGDRCKTAQGNYVNNNNLWNVKRRWRQWCSQKSIKREELSVDHGSFS